MITSMLAREGKLCINMPAKNKIAQGHYHGTITSLQTPEFISFSKWDVNNNSSSQYEKSEKKKKKKKEKATVK